jgi:thioredoxin-related protein
MKKFLLILLTLSTVFAGSVNWEKNLETAAAKAKATGKKVMIMMSTQSCRYCKQMHKEVFADDTVAAYINEHFVALELDVNNDPYPEALEVRGVPATFFFSSDLKTRYELLMGPRHPMVFMNILQTVQQQ